MRITDNRYAGERDKFELAGRMIRHGARTGTIRAFTGFSEDRIRKIYATYYKGNGIKRLRGKSPTHVGHFVSNAARQAEATLLAGYLTACMAVRLDHDGRPVSPDAVDQVTLGHRICLAYEHYCGLCQEPQLSFEWALALYRSLVDSRELKLASCHRCEGDYVQDSYALDDGTCPVCRMKSRLARAG